MNWIDALVHKIIKTPEDTSYDEELFGALSGRGIGLEMLGYWLNKEFWNFDRGYCQFDGASEGHCILAGIEPENSMQTNDQYGPAFFPDSLEFYGYPRITTENQWHLKEAVDRRISDLRSLGLKGRVRCHEALQECAKFKLDPPWLDAANNDFECAKRIPAKLRTNSEIINRISRTASSKGGLKRASKNSVTEFLNTVCRKEFEKFEVRGFPNCPPKTSGLPKATDIANAIYFTVCDKAEEIGIEPPKPLTIEGRVRQWLKNSTK